MNNQQEQSPNTALEFDPGRTGGQTKLIITIIKLVVILCWLEIVFLVCWR